MFKKAAALTVLLLVLVALGVSRSRGQSAATLHLPHVAGIAVREAEVRPIETISGQAEAYRTTTIASEVAGRVLRRPNSGDAVAAGGTMLEVDPEMAQADLDQAIANAARAWAACHQAEAEYQRAEVETAANQRQAQAQLEAAEAANLKLAVGSRPQELRSAEAALSQAVADENLAERDAVRYQTLLQQGAIPTQVWDQAQARLQMAQARRRQAEAALSLAREGARREDRLGSHAQVESAQAALAIANTRDLRLATLQQQVAGLRAQALAADASVRAARLAFDRHHVLAPFAGRVLATMVEQGDLVAPGTPLLRFGDVRHMKATFQVPERTRRSLTLGAALDVQCDAVAPAPFHGRITTLGFQADPRTRTFPIEIAIDNPQQRLLPGMVVKLEIGHAAEHRLVVPIASVATDGTISYVYVVAQGKAARRPVHLGAPSGSDVVVTDGLVAGETVASNPQVLTDGEEVEP